ncbi:sulfotransferase [Geitlerinema sp. PCC 9228]|uniref:sulfotransferase family protein n=1 Tax=Geitlerinema sp. PCC 9228 TaxID=111611 RepID=UPI0008F9A01F|nr:sulfotransferase [Geitlerinema sp. PCC 9228]
MLHPPLAIAGMHRSGTSLTAAFLQALGVDLGEEFWQADRHNAKGYFEDIDFLQFQRSLLADCCPQDDGGWVDWGWTENEQLDRQKFSNYTEAAKELLRKRQKHRWWGWKDPRTTLLLDFWQELLPETNYILVYRYPWDVVDSIFRLNAPIFLENPDYPLKIWQYYNRHLWDFYRRHPHRCILCNVNRLWEEPEKLVQLLREKFQFSSPPHWQAKPEAASIFDAQMFRQLPRNHPLVGLLERLYPESLQLLANLDSVADLPSGFSGNLSNSENSEAAELVLQMYRDSLQSMQQQQKYLWELQQLRSQLATIQASKFWPVYQGWHNFKKQVWGWFFR